MNKLYCKASVIGTRLHLPVALFCIGMAVYVLIK